MSPDEPKIIVALYLNGEHLDPDSVTREFGVVPSRAQKKGERRVTSSGREVLVKQGSWAWSVELGSTSLDDHLARLIRSFPTGKPLSEIANVEDAYIDVFVALSSNLDGDAKCELDIKPDVLVSLAQLGLPIRMTVDVVRE
ncbi:DUF4279 domain-containing protein [Cupriavidus basilensis]|uniref:DUF4279 domain-containing protein n=1 Tax=Cupriavidus basilensis TaxID=68895 RepID=UPI0009E4D59B|nr:DUF4279 domain-containing protein [Cupriavidus basilensis]